MCPHKWIFTTPGHIKCTLCPAVGQRWFTPAEKRAHKSGKWFYLEAKA